MLKLALPYRQLGYDIKKLAGMPSMQGMPPMPPSMQGMQLTPMFFPTQMATFDGKRMRRSVQRKTVDYNAPVFEYIEDRLYKKSLHGSPVLQPHKAYYIDVSVCLS